MLEQAALDAVLIATPHHLHAEQVIAAAEANCTVISEKPMATSLEEAAAVLDAVARHDVVIYSRPQRRLYPRYPARHRAFARGRVARTASRPRQSIFPMTEAHHRASPARFGGPPKRRAAAALAIRGTTRYIRSKP